MMKKLLLALMVALSALSAAAAEADKIDISPYVAPNCGVPQASWKVLESKLNRILTASGFVAEGHQRFILTANVNILTEDVTDTAPPKFAYTLSFDLYIGDGMSGTLYASTQIEAKGVGNTKDKAYMQALKGVNPRSPQLKEFVEVGKQKIVDYYNMHGEEILKRAQALANNQDYDAAMWELSCIPEACGSFYSRACDMMVSIYNKQIAEEGSSMLAEARAIWNAGQDREAADKAGAILASINPKSPAFAAAQQLHSQIAARIKTIDDREWRYTMQEQSNEHDLAKAQVLAARDVAVAYASHQPVYNYVVHWW